MGLGAALGAKLAAPEREVIRRRRRLLHVRQSAAVHYVARAENLPTLTIVSNNQSWHAVRAATLDVYPGGRREGQRHAADRTQALARLRKVIATCGGRRKGRGTGDLPAALKRGLDAVRSGTPALLNVITQGRNS